MIQIYSKMTGTQKVKAGGCNKIQILHAIWPKVINGRDKTTDVVRVNLKQAGKTDVSNHFFLKEEYLEYGM